MKTQFSAQFSTVVMIFLFLGLTACGPKIQPRAKERLEKPIDCQTAQHDLMVLEEEKASTGRQISDGVQSVLPIMAVINLIDGEYQDGVKVATGQYNRAIDRKIKELKVKCGVS